MYTNMRAEMYVGGARTLPLSMHVRDQITILSIHDDELR